MRILLVNQIWFKTELIKYGHAVYTIGFGQQFDFVPKQVLNTLESVIAEFLDGIAPDIIIVLDNSSPLWLMGLADSKIPKIFYSVDTQHSPQFHAALGLSFDSLLVAQSDYIPVIEQDFGVKAEWLPLWASESVAVNVQKEHTVVFVGTLNAELNPDRVEFFSELNKIVPILCIEGAWQAYFPKALIVINQTVKGDLNFRVFETLISGALLLTERSGNGLFDIFQEDVHLVCYEKGNLQEAVQKIKYYLEHSVQAQKIADAGRKLVLAGHLEQHRARRINEICHKLNVEKKHIKSHQFGWMVNCSELARAFQVKRYQDVNRVWEYARQAAEKAVHSLETMNDYLSCVFVVTCLHYDQVYISERGLQLLEVALPNYGHYTVITYTLIHRYLEQGYGVKAEQLARQVNSQAELEVTYAAARQIVASILGASTFNNSIPKS